MIPCRAVDRLERTLRDRTLLHAEILEGNLGHLCNRWHSCTCRSCLLGAALLLKPPLLRRAALFCKPPLFRKPQLLGRAALFRKPLLFRKPPLLLGAAPPFRLGGIRPGLAVAAAILTKPEKSQESRSRGEKKGTGKGGHVLEKQPCADVGDV